MYSFGLEPKMYSKKKMFLEPRNLFTDLGPYLHPLCSTRTKKNSTFFRFFISILFCYPYSLPVFSVELNETDLDPVYIYYCVI